MATAIILEVKESIINSYFSRKSTCTVYPKLRVYKASLILMKFYSVCVAVREAMEVRSQCLEWGIQSWHLREREISLKVVPYIIIRWFVFFRVTLKLLKDEKNQLIKL